MTVARDEVLEGFLGSLERAATEGKAPADLAHELRIEPGVLEEARARLEEDGFAIAEEEGRWRLEEAPDLLLPHWVRSRLRTDRLGSLIYYREEVGSTQDVAFDLVVEGKGHGTLVVAEHQTEGRGRSDREWRSCPRRSLQFSLILDLEPPGTFASVLTVASATAIARAVRDIADLPASLKFPNDVLVRGKKVAGILIEMKDYGVPPPRAVVGIGVNVNQALEDIPEELRATATSLRLERRGERPISRVLLLRRILTDLERWLDQIALDRYEDLEGAWNRYSGMVNREVSFRAGGEEHRGRVLDATLREGFRLRLGDGQERAFRLEHVVDLRLL